MRQKVLHAVHLCQLRKLLHPHNGEIKPCKCYPTTGLSASTKLAFFFIKRRHINNFATFQNQAVTNFSLVDMQTKLMSIPISSSLFKAYCKSL